MRDYGKIYTSFWTSETTRALSEDGRLLALYLLSSPHTTMIGAFRVPDGYVAEDLSWGLERVSKGFRNLSENGWAKRNAQTGWVVICRYLEWNPIDNPNQATSAVRLLNAMPSSIAEKPAIARAVAISCKRFIHKIPPETRNRLETLAKGFRNQEQEQDQDQEQEYKKEVGRPTPPSPPAVLDLGADPDAEPPRNATPRMRAIYAAMQREAFLVPGKGEQTLWENAKRPIQLAKKLDESCPSVDVSTLIAKLAGWTVANPKRAKRDLARFVWNAAVKDQDRPKAGADEMYRHGTDLADKVRGTRRGGR